MAKPTSRRRTTRTERAGDGGQTDPATILAAWKQAVDTAGRTFLSVPLSLAGIAPHSPKKGALAQAARGFPLVGLAIGLAGALVYAVADGLNLPPLLSAVLAIGVIVFLSGAHPEGGLARMADMIVSGTNPADRLALLQEYRPGPYGTIVILIDFALRAGALAWLALASEVAVALAASCAASRGALPLLMHYLPPARKSGFAFTAGKPRFDQAVLAALMGAAIALLFLGPVTGIVALAVGALGALKFYWLARHLLGGVTGSVLGAAQQGAEIGMLLAIVALR